MRPVTSFSNIVLDLIHVPPSIIYCLFTARRPISYRLTAVQDLHAAHTLNIRVADRPSVQTSECTTLSRSSTRSHFAQICKTPHRCQLIYPRALICTGKTNAHVLWCTFPRSVRSPPYARTYTNSNSAKKKNLRYHNALSHDTRLHQCSLLSLSCFAHANVHQQLPNCSNTRNVQLICIWDLRAYARMVGPFRPSSPTQLCVVNLGAYSTTASELYLCKPSATLIFR